MANIKAQLTNKIAAIWRFPPPKVNGTGKSRWKILSNVVIKLDQKIIVEMTIAQLNQKNVLI